MSLLYVFSNTAMFSFYLNHSFAWHGSSICHSESSIFFKYNVKKRLVISLAKVTFFRKSFSLVFDINKKGGYGILPYDFL